jgi:hypothetical protein
VPIAARVCAISWRRLLVRISTLCSNWTRGGSERAAGASEGDVYFFGREVFAFEEGDAFVDGGICYAGVLQDFAMLVSSSFINVAGRSHMKPVSC